MSKYSTSDALGCPVRAKGPFHGGWIDVKSSGNPKRRSWQVGINSRARGSVKTLLLEMRMPVEDRLQAWLIETVTY
jgi:hypothetical protein